MSPTQWFHLLFTEKANPWDRTGLMDPRTLSIEQGKEFLRQVGIPQRDVSMGDVRLGRETWRNEVDPFALHQAAAKAGSPRGDNNEKETGKSPGRFLSLCDRKISSCGPKGGAIVILFCLHQINLMTEKWVVDASVEVLLRFPLRPGEDPTARCVPQKKCPPSAHKPRSASQRPGGQDGRSVQGHAVGVPAVVRWTKSLPAAAQVRVEVRVGSPA